MRCDTIGTPPISSVCIESLELVVVAFPSKVEAESAQCLASVFIIIPSPVQTVRGLQQ